MRQFFAGFLSTFVQWYAFFFFSQLSFVIFPLYIFVIGFIFRIIGSIVFGYLGDKISRKIALISINIILSISSLLVFFFPVIFSLVLYRIVQGLTLGGEWGGASTIILETYSNSRYRGFILSFVQLTVPLAVIFSSLSIIFVYNTGNWKIFLLLIFLLSLISIPLFKNTKEKVNSEGFPLIQSIREDWRNILKAVGIKISESAVFYIFTTFIFSIGNVALLVIIAMISQILTIPFFGYLSDIIGRKRVEYIGLLVLLIGSLYFPSTSGEILFSISDSALYAPQSSIFTEIFKRKYRYTASSFSYQFASIIGGIFPPVILSVLRLKADIVLLPYAIVSFISLLKVSETKGKKVD